jgi:hypothetical protein
MNQGDHVEQGHQMRNNLGFRQSADDASVDEPVCLIEKQMVALSKNDGNHGQSRVAAQIPLDEEVDTVYTKFVSLLDRKKRICLLQ